MPSVERAASEQPAAPALIAGRYAVRAELGRGGMGRVYRVCDQRDGVEVALKQLQLDPDARKQAERMHLFAREYHALSELAHPCIVEVRDYGVDEGQAYYTMELLRGQSLRDRGQLPWREACKLLRDIASGLALLHSRRYVHRDVTPRNVYCIEGGRPKLLDFGLMAPSGVFKTVMGTPPFVAPEAMNLQHVDGRHDLYALGATAYWVLTGRHAYPARRLSELHDLWRSAPAPPSLIDAQIPEPLSRLVMSMLNLDPHSRPSTAAEVIERLDGIAGLEADRAIATSAAYLTTPKLVGRDDALAKVRVALIAAARGRGGSLMIDGHVGVGRSRFLDACVLEGKILGFTVLRADSTDAGGPYGVARTLCEQLIAHRPEKAEGAAKNPWLTRILSGLAGMGSPEERDALQEALQEWFLEACRERPVLFAVDDVDQIDEPSLAMLAMLGLAARENGFAIVVTSALERASHAPQPHALLATRGQRIRLRALSAADALTLLSSVFGAAPNIEMLADRLHVSAAGNPRALVELSEHLVRSGAVRHDAGSWSLPIQLGDDQLSDSLEQVRTARIAALSADACALAEALSMRTTEAFSIEEAALLRPGVSSARLHHSMGELVSSGIVSPQGASYALSHRGYVDLFGKRIDEARKRELHGALAGLLRARGAAPYEVAWHLQAAGEDAAAIDTLVAWLEPTLDDPNRAPHVGSELRRTLGQLERAIEVSERLGRPPRERYVMRSALVALGSYAPAVFHRHGPPLLEELSALSGLAAYRALPAELEAQKRLTQALTEVQQRFDATPESQRVLSPIDAVSQLARFISAQARVAGGTFDRALIEALPSIEPLSPLSPLLQVVAEACVVVNDLLDARYLRVCERWRARVQLNTDITAVVYALGLVEAALGMREALDRAERCEAEAAYRIQAWRIRMTYHLARGDWHEADACRKQEERLRIAHGGIQDLEGSHLHNLMIAYSRADDLIGVKQTLDGLGPMAERFPGWVPIKLRGEAEYHRLRGDYPRALEHYDHALSQMAAGHHPVWYLAVEGKLVTLLELGRAEEAQRVALEAIAVCEREDLGLGAWTLERLLALAEARLGQHAAAVLRIEAVIASYERVGVSGLLLAAAHECRARIALAVEDEAMFDQSVARCSEVYGRTRSAALRAKLSRLLGEARSRGLQPAAVCDDPRTTMTRTQTATGTLQSVLAGCRGPAERARQALRLLLIEADQHEGFLYTVVQDHGATLGAAVGTPPGGLDEFVEQFLSYHRAADDEQTEVLPPEEEEQAEASRLFEHDGSVYRPLLLRSSHQDREWLSGVLVVRHAPGAHVLVPHDALRAVSAMLVDAGDVVSELSAGPSG